MTDSKLDTTSIPLPGKHRPCPHFLELSDKKTAECEGLDGHPGPHHARIAVEWVEK